jgi:phosphatidylethanolamine-binding protein (PEBP) family uncharacterized protein
VLSSVHLDDSVHFAIEYTHGGKHYPVTPGVVLTATQVQHFPKISWDAKPGELYTLIMADPDAKDRKHHEFRCWRHFTKVNIPGNDVSQGKELAGFVPTGAPKDTGLHRYVWMLYRQSGTLQIDEPHIASDIAGGRAKFNVEAWAKKHGLGEPVAVTWYEAEYDSFVDELYARFRG